MRSNRILAAAWAVAALLLYSDAYGVLARPEPELQYPEIVPKPVSHDYGEGYFTLCSGTMIEAGEGVDFLTQHWFRSTIRMAYPDRWRFPLPQTYNEIELRFSDAVPRAEGYRIEVRPEKVVIEGRDRAGLFYGMQTFLQLLPPSVYRRLELPEDYYIPVQTIEDYPRFEYRGMMLDVARTFQPKENVMRHIDRMAAHKLNKLHFHLTDDEGWRIALDCYPALAETGGFRGGDRPLRSIYGNFGEEYGGYFTKEELAEIVTYAAFRNVEIIPEIDLPGHSRAAAKAHPEILCAYTYNTGPTAGDDRRNVWCASREANYAMLERIIAELAPVFPSRYFHIGGDEVAYGQWRTCPDCKDFMKDHGMKEAAELEDYFIERVSDILRRHGKIPAVWDEAIKRDTLAEGSVVYAWSNIDTGKKATEDGYKMVIMPGHYFYIDMKQAPEEFGQTWAGVVPAEKLYNFGLVRNGFDADQLKNVKGVEGTFFSEILLPYGTHGREDYFEYMTWPRMAALAEVAWTDESARDWAEFSARLDGWHLDRLSAMGINYRLEPPVADYKSGRITVTDNATPGVVRYTTDGSDPTPESAVYTGSIETADPWDYRFTRFHDGLYSASVSPKAVKIYNVPSRRTLTFEIPISEIAADTGLWYLRARTPGVNFRINKLAFAGQRETQTLIARGQAVNDLHLMRWYVNEDNSTGRATVTVTNSGPYDADILLEFSKSSYIQPKVRLTSSLNQSRNFPFANVEDYNFTTYTRTSATCRKGDWFQYTFAEPVDARSIEVQTGLSYMPRYHIPFGRVQLSADGVTFTDSATLDYHGHATVYPQGEVKAVRIVSDSHGNSEAAVALQDLRIRPR